MTNELTAYASAIQVITPHARRYLRYLDRVYRSVDFEGRRVLDVGGGNGVHSYYAAARGAAKVTCLDPIEDGSNPAMEGHYAHLEQRVGGPVEKVRSRFQDHQVYDPYDVVIVHNAINHLDEDACAALPDDERARESYKVIFKALRVQLRTGGFLVVADCARRNLLGDLNLHNPIAPTIEWHIHQQPETWLALMSKAGFARGGIRWNAHWRLGRPGQLLLGNRLGAYATSSHFTITAQAV